MIGAFAQMVMWTIGLIVGLIVLAIVLFLLDRRLSRRPRARVRRRVVYLCTITGCNRPTEPQDGPFCSEHTWADA